MQNIKQASTLRISTKLNKPAPRVVFRTGSQSGEIAELHIRTIAAILAWVDVALLIANFYFKSESILLMSIAIVIIAVLIYFIPRLRK